VLVPGELGAERPHTGRERQEHFSVASSHRKEKVFSGPADGRGCRAPGSAPRAQPPFAGARGARGQRRTGREWTRSGFGLAGPLSIRYLQVHAVGDLALVGLGCAQQRLDRRVWLEWRRRYRAQGAPRRWQRCSRRVGCSRQRCVEVRCRQ
jgi:hypothetical protein